MPWIKHLFALINALVADRARLAMENVAVRQQLVQAQRETRQVEDGLGEVVATVADVNYHPARILSLRAHSQD